MRKIVSLIGILGMLVSTRTSAQPCAPELIDIEAGATEWSVWGDMAMLDQGDWGLQFYQSVGGDVELVSEMPGIQGAMSVDIGASTAAVRLAGAHSVRLIDVSDLAAPSLGAVVETPGTSIYRVLMSGDLMALMRSGDFYLYDVSDASNPVQLSHRVLPRSSTAAVIGEGFLVLRDWEGLVVWDITDPSDPQPGPQIWGDQCSVDGDRMSLYRTGNLPNPGGEFRLYDMQNPLSPLLLGTGWESTSGYHEASHALVGDHLIFRLREQVSPTATMKIWDVSDPQNPVWLYTNQEVSVQFPTVASTFTGRLGGEVVFLQDGALWAYDDLDTSLSMSYRAGERPPTLIAEHNGNLVGLRDGMVFVGPKAPIGAFEATGTVDLVQNFPHPNSSFQHIHTDGSIVFVLAADYSVYPQAFTVYSVDVSNPASPVIVDSVSGTGAAVSVGFHDSHIYVMEKTVQWPLNEMVHAISVGVSGDLDLVGQNKASVEYSSIVLGYQNALYEIYHGSVRVHDISDPALASFVAAYTFPGGRGPHFIVGDRMYCNATDAPYKVIDLSTPLTPLEIMAPMASIPDSAWLLAERDGVLYFSDDGELIRVDVNNPDQPVVLGVHPFIPVPIPEYWQNRVHRLIGDRFYVDVSASYDTIPVERFVEFDVSSCGSPSCPPDLAPPFGVLNFFDLSAFLTAYNTQNPTADFAQPFGVFNFFDVSAFLSAYNAGCP